MRILKITMMIALLAAAGCKKDSPIKTSVDGNFKGFVFVSGSSTPWQPDSIQVSFAVSNYKSKTFLNELNLYDNGSEDSGTYSVKGDSVQVTDLVVHPGTTYVPGLGIHFGGTFRFQIKTDSLILTRTESGMLYTYRLKKQ